MYFLIDFLSSQTLKKYYYAGYSFHGLQYYLPGLTSNLSLCWLRFIKHFKISNLSELKSMKVISIKYTFRAGQAGNENSSAEGLQLWNWINPWEEFEVYKYNISSYTNSVSRS